MSTTAWIVIGIVAVVAVLAIAFAARAATMRKRRAEADRIRQEVDEEGKRLQRREAHAV